MKRGRIKAGHWRKLDHNLNQGIWRPRTPWALGCVQVPCCFPSIPKYLRTHFPTQGEPCTGFVVFPLHCSAGLSAGLAGRLNIPLSSGPWAGLVCLGLYFFPLNLPYSNCHSLTALCQEHAVILQLRALIPSL